MKIKPLEQYDNSAVSTYQTCPMKFYMKYIRGLEKNTVDDTNIDVLFGKKVHTFLEHYYLKQQINVKELWADFISIDSNKAKSQDGGVYLCNQYHRQYGNIDKDMEILELESVHEFDLGGNKFIVKKDGVVRLKGSIYALEHKTTSSISYNYFDRYFINSQISAQTYSTKLKYGECSGVILNAIEVKFLKRKSKDRDAGLNVRFERDILNRTPQELIDWEDNVLNWIEKIKDDCNDGNFLKSDGGYACSNYRGCSMKELCKSSIGMQLDEQIIECMYHAKDDVWEYLK